MSTIKAKEKISESLKELEKIVEWFDEQKEVDIEKGLEMVQKGAEIIKSLKGRLKDVDNQFQEIKKDIETENE